MNPLATDSAGLNSDMDFNSLAENASRLGARLQETLSEQTRELNIARASSSVYLDNPEDKVRNIKKQLDSNSDREKLEAMKRLVGVRHLAFILRLVF